MAHTYTTFFSTVCQSFSFSIRFDILIAIVGGAESFRGGFVDRRKR